MKAYEMKSNQTSAIPMRAGDFQEGTISPSESIEALIKVAARNDDAGARRRLAGCSIAVCSKAILSTLLRRTGVASVVPGAAAICEKPVRIPSGAMFAVELQRPSCTNAKAASKSECIGAMAAVRVRCWYAAISELGKCHITLIPHSVSSLDTSERVLDPRLNDTYRHHELL
eukprot:6175417-Pleurochrysis_carterae.AAC.4